MTCERHKLIKQLEDEGKSKNQIYDAARWMKCTCTIQRIWCDYCRGSTVCLLCSNRDGTPLNDNHKYCPRCGGKSKCHYCNEIGEMWK